MYDFNELTTPETLGYLGAGFVGFFFVKASVDTYLSWRDSKRKAALAVQEKEAIQQQEAQPLTNLTHLLEAMQQKVSTEKYNKAVKIGKKMYLALRESGINLNLLTVTCNGKYDFTYHFEAADGVYTYNGNGYTTPEVSQIIEDLKKC